MSQLLSLTRVWLRPHQVCSPAIAPVFRKRNLPLLRHSQPRCALTLTASRSMESNEDIDTRLLYEPLEVERLEYYQPGAYQPVQIGDYFHGWYRVVHKLGHGSFSTAWLARDEQLNRYVADKVCTANANPKEVDIISRLTTPRCPSDIHAGKMVMPSIWIDSPFTARTVIMLVTLQHRRVSTSPGRKMAPGFGYYSLT